MDVVLEAYFMVLPLFLIAFFGFSLQKKFELDEKPFAKLIVYLFSPIVAIGALSKLQFNVHDFILPAIVFTLCNSFGFSLGIILPKFLPKRDASLATFMSTIPNSGFFGIALIDSLLGEKAVAYQTLIAYFGVGMVCYTTALYFLASGSMSPKDSIAKLFKMPFIYACFAGILISVNNLELPKFADKVYILGKSSFIFLAMFTLGIVARKAVYKVPCAKVLSLTLINRFVLWPIAILIILIIDTKYIDFLSNEAHTILLCNMFLPVGMNSINFSIILGSDPNVATTMVVLTTILSMLLIPLTLILPI